MKKYFPTELVIQVFALLVAFIVIHAFYAATLRNLPTLLTPVARSQEQSRNTLIVVPHAQAELLLELIEELELARLPVVIMQASAEGVA